MTLEQVEKTHPFVAVFLVHRVAAGRVQQDAFGGEEPVAVAGAAHAAHRRAVLVGEGELQAGIDHRAALARGGVADHDVPGQLVQRFVARHLADLGRLDGAHRLHQARAQRVHVPAIGGRAAGLHLLLQHVPQVLVGAARAAPAPQIGAQPEQQEYSQRDAGPGQADLDGVGKQEQEHDQGDQADRHEQARIAEGAGGPMATFAQGAGDTGKET
ncbi:Uncharacterised protein [Achromobacter xylosoxidans]|nr:Uncharacterised protein [Achromobacter xylosoxidans]